MLYINEERVLNVGFESYNFKIRTLEYVNTSLIRDVFQNMGYDTLDENILEKPLENGYIEVLITDNNISIRTAKANSEQVIFKIVDDIKTLNDIFQVSAFDLQTNKELLPSNFNQTLEKFTLLRNEFCKNYPDIRCPIRCNDVFSGQKDGGTGKSVSVGDGSVFCSEFNCYVKSWAIIFI